MGKIAFELRPARAEEAECLTELAMRSKAHWGYDADFMARCRDELTVKPEDIKCEVVIAAEAEGKVVGFGCLSAVEDAEGAGSEGEIWHFFVEPSAMGTGLGRALMERLFAEARDLGLKRLRVDSDPGAQGFYERMGFVYHSEAPSGSIAGRSLPHLRLTL